jgi:H2-forming N5,N10-methylenetetrahydromethanopterin dehydrogenase
MNIKAIFIVSIILLYTFNTQAQSLLEDKDVPKIVKDSLNKIYPEIQNPKWFLVKDNYEAVYDTDRAILLTAYGNVIAEMNNVVVDGIPEGILRYFKLNEPNTKLISSRRMVMYEDGRVYYIVNSNKQYYKFNTKGQLLEKADLEK